MLKMLSSMSAGMFVGDEGDKRAGICFGACAGICVGVTGMFVGPAMTVDVHHEVGGQHDDELVGEVRRSRPRKDGFATMKMSPKSVVNDLEDMAGRRAR